MQKVIRRTAQAEAQAARSLAKRKAKTAHEFLRTNREQKSIVAKDVTLKLKEARQARREDWELGSLAPNRAAGDKKISYGTLPMQRTRGENLTWEERIERNQIFGGRYLNLRAGDRVVILEGRDKGKIGDVTNVSAARSEVTVKGLNMMDVVVPSYYGQEAGSSPTRSIEQPVPFEAIRLVYPLKNPETGELRDVIIKKIVNTKIWFDKHTGKKKWQRMIPGLNKIIPWPKQDPKPPAKDNDCDTLRKEVDLKTFVPSLLRAPMPTTVIDELRNKYSIFRTRHDEEYIAAKVAEDQAKQEQKKLMEQMRTPLKDAKRQERKLRKAKGKGTLTKGMLARIGEVISRKRSAAVAGTVEGLKKETPIAA